MEITSQTNIALYMNRTTWLGVTTPGLNALTNGLGLSASYTNGTIMLGYDDPDRNVSGPSSYVLFSNVRVVEMAPYITVQPGLTNSGKFSLIYTQGDNTILTAAVAYASAPITNRWFRGTAVAPGTGTAATPTALIQSNSVNANTMTDYLVLTNLAQINGTNYMAVFSDPAGSVTSTVVAVEVVLTPAPVVSIPGIPVQLQVRAVGPVAPTAYQWQTNGVNLVNGTKYAGVTSTNLFITNAQPADAMVYSVIVTHPAGTVTQFATLTMGGSVTPVTPASITNLAFTTAKFSVTATGSGLTYRWKYNGANLSNIAPVTNGATTATLTLSNITLANAGTYTVGVSNSAGGLVVGTGVLKVVYPTLAGIIVVGPNVVLTYDTYNSPNSEGPNAYVLQSAGVVTGPCLNNTTGAIRSRAGLFRSPCLRQATQCSTA